MKQESKVKNIRKFPPKIVRRFLMVLLLIMSFQIPNTLAQNSKVEKKMLPPLNPQRVSRIDVKHIALDLRFDWKKKQAFGTSTITLSPLFSTDEITLDAAMMTINSISLIGGKSLKYEYANGAADDNLQIHLDRIYKTTESLTVKINYRTNWENKADPNNIWGSYGKGVRFFQPTYTTPKKRRQIWSAGEPESNRYWFPGYDSINDLRTSEFTATIEKPLMVISNGELKEIKENSDGTRTFHYKADNPYPNYLTSFVVGEYIDVRQKVRDIELHTFGYPDEKDGIEATIVRLPEMMEFFVEKTGAKYPYSRYSQVTAQDYIFPGLVGQNTVSTMSDNMIDDHGTHKDFLYLWDGVEAKSLASQWFGNLISPKDWRDIWLNAAFSHYFDELFNIYKNGNEEFLTYSHNNDLTTDLSVWQSGYRHPIVTRNYKDLDTLTSDTYVSIRGTLVLHMLRKHLGDEKWWNAIRLYVKSNANKQVTTEDFQKAVEDASGEKMGWFFEQWIHKMGHPIFEVSKIYDATSKQFSIIVKQTQKIDKNDEYPQVEYFQGKIDLEIDEKIETVWLKPQAENVFTFTRNSEPKLVNFDYESTWIKEITFAKSQEELLFQLKNSKDILARRFAINELGKIAKDENTSPVEKAKIHKALREIASGNSYWRLRATALSQLQNLAAPPVSTNSIQIDEATSKMLIRIINKESSWLKASAINFLGMTRDEKFADIYIEAFQDKSDRVVNSAAKALGKSKSPRAFDELVKLMKRPSWKSQSLISTLDGLAELKEPRGVEIAMRALENRELPRWWLATPIWDYPITAVDTLIALEQTEAAYPLLFGRFKKSLEDEDYNDIFSNVLLISRLGDPRAKEIFVMLKTKFKNDENAMLAVTQYETQFEQLLQKK